MAVRTCKGHAAGGYNPHVACDNSVIEFAGLVLGTREENGYDDSDFYALVWDAEQGRPREVCYASTRGWTYHNGAQVDATPEVVAAATEWFRRAWVDVVTAREQARAVAVRPGRRVRSLTTRGKARGVVGVVGWMGEDKYKSTRYATYYRVGVDPDGGGARVFMPADRVAVVDPEPVDVEEIRAQAARMGEPNWCGVLQSLALHRTGSLVGV